MSTKGHAGVACGGAKSRETVFSITCLACGWSGRVEAATFEEAFKKGMPGHTRESRRSDDGGAVVCASEVFEISRALSDRGEGTYFVSCVCCSWAHPVKANGSRQALTLGAIKHAHDCGETCANKAMEVEESLETRWFG